jgi:hypothetical protein
VSFGSDIFVLVSGVEYAAYKHSQVMLCMSFTLIHRRDPAQLSLVQNGTSMRQQ